MKIILADDHQIISDGIESILAELPNVQVVAKVQNGKDLIDMVRSVKPEMVISDISMPVLNGMEACQEIKKDYPEVKVLMLSMYDEPSMIRQLISAGADGYVLKQADKLEILDAVTKIRNGGKYFSSDVTMALHQVDSTVNHQSDNVLKISLLTEREQEVMKAICDGLNNKEIGQKLFISHRTVDTHRTNLMRKLEVNNVTQLIRLALKAGMIE